jgi:hypothetical protein
MRRFARTSLVLGGLLLVAFGVLVLGSLAGFVPIALERPLEAIGMGGEGGRLAAAGLAGGGLVAAIVSFGFGFGIRRQARTFALPAPFGLPGDVDGGVWVTRESLGSLVEHSASTIRGVRASASKVRLRRKDPAWAVAVDIAVTRDVALREVTTALHSSIDGALVFHTGIPLGVLDVRAHVDDRKEREIVRVH